ncbi:MAG TPA: hypothetical protein H9900_03065 [Candidatus Monoglobus merdigallinarum]|uniref:Uncharacterized protein n=1 Tax=Candidatus Monoglobus merdigallinarum TaxID=2838698 RepID=A0A9D1TM43_9FIRM|nr:hypothetical protein [Candidatus Monoglobus merdigallinarum]
MKRKTFYIIAAVWFLLVVIVVGGSFIPGVDENIKNEVRRYMVWIVGVGAVSLMLIRRMVKDDD